MTEPPPGSPATQKVVKIRLETGSLLVSFLMAETAQSDFTRDLSKVVKKYAPFIVEYLPVDSGSTVVPVRRTAPVKNRRARPLGYYATMRVQLEEQIIKGNLEEGEVRLSKRGWHPPETQEKYWELVDAGLITDPVARPPEYKRPEHYEGKVIKGKVVDD